MRDVELSVKGLRLQYKKENWKLLWLCGCVFCGRSTRRIGRGDRAVCRCKVWYSDLRMFGLCHHRPPRVELGEIHGNVSLGFAPVAELSGWLDLICYATSGIAHSQLLPRRLSRRIEWAREKLGGGGRQYLGWPRRLFSRGRSRT